MSYSMTHLVVANEFAKSHTITNKEMFLLGAFCPDVVHERSGYEKWMKEKSHFCPDGLIWGTVYETEPMLRWYNSLRDIYQMKIELASDEDTDSFLQGMTIHILTDIYNSKVIYGPAVRKYGQTTVFENGEYRNQCLSVDMQLFRQYADNKKIVEALQQSIPQVSRLQILEKLQIESLISIEEMQLFLLHFREKYEKEEPSQTMEDMISLPVSKKFIEYTVKQSDQLLFLFPDTDSFQV